MSLEDVQGRLDVSGFRDVSLGSQRLKFFKKSNVYLHAIADKAIGKTVDSFKGPAKKVGDISAIDLRHRPERSICVT